MKLLFLDMDGVLNSYQSSHYVWKMQKGRKTFLNHFEELCPIACSNLDHVLEKIPDLKIVLSSTWRLGYWEDFENSLAARVPSAVGRVLDRTPCHRDSQRGDEIYEWLHDNEHLSTPYVVIDDDSDMDKVKENFLHIDGRTGLTWVHVEEIFKRFKIYNWDRP